MLTMEVMEQSHRCEVIKRFVDMELSPKKAKKLSQACSPATPLLASDTSEYCRVTKGAGQRQIAQ